MGSHHQDGTGCHSTIELLPWLINGSLEADEERALLDHLSACESCRLELEETAQVQQLLSRHLPSFALAEYGLGVEPGGLDRERVERHLAVCPRCSQELEWIRGDGVIDLGAVRRERFRAGWIPINRRLEAGWQRWAIAAGMAAVLAFGGLVGFRIDFGASGSRVELSDLGSEGVALGHSPATHALLQDGFESGSLKSWSTAQGEESAIQRQ